MVGAGEDVGAVVVGPDVGDVIGRVGDPVSGAGGAGVVQDNGVGREVGAGENAQPCVGDVRWGEAELAAAVGKCVEVLAGGGGGGSRGLQLRGRYRLWGGEDWGGFGGEGGGG